VHENNISASLNHLVVCLKFRRFLGIADEKSEFFEVFNFFFKLCGVENRLGWHTWIEKRFLDPGYDIRKIHVSIVVEFLETMLEVQHNPWGL